MKKVHLFFFLTCLLFWACTPKLNNTVTDTAKTEMSSKGETAVTSETSTSMDEMIPADNRVVRGKLSNGMHYYIQKNGKPENRAELRLAVNAGSILEDEDQLGLAHFVEHMAFNGSKNFEKNELVDFLEMAGARFGPDLNAYTSFDETVYMLQVRTDSTALLDKGMLILKDWASGISFDEEEIDKERGVVESEWRSRLSPDQRMQKEYFPVMYQGSQYAKRLPIGKPEIIKNASYDAVKRFYRDWYRPDLMAVVVVGDVDIPTIEKQIQELFAPMPANPSPRDRKKYKVPHHKETLFSIASDKEASFTNVRIMYKHDGKETKNLGDYRGTLVKNLYNAMLGARLDEIGRQPEPPFVFAYTGYGQDVGDIDVYRSYSMVPEGKAAKAFEVLLTENQRVLQHGFNQTEMEREMKNMMTRAEKSLKEMDKTESARLAMRYVYNYLDNNPIPSPEQIVDLYGKYFPTIQLEEINALAKKWIRNESRVVVVTGPEKNESPLPTESELRAIMEKVDNSTLTAYEDEVSTQPFFDKTLAPIAIKLEKTMDKVGLEYFELENGVEVYLKKTDFKNDEILMRSTSPGGTSLYSDKDYADASNASRIVNEAGIGDFSSNQLQKLMAGKVVRVSPFIGSTSEGFNGSASPNDMETMFQMVYMYFHQPRVDPDAFTSYLSKQKGIYKNLMSNPNFFFMDQTMKIKYNNHPRMGFPSAEEMDKIQYNNAMKIYRERFEDASDFTFFFVGNFDEAKIKEMAQRYLGNLPSTNRKEEWKDLGIRVVDGKVNEKINKGKAPKTQVELFFHGDFDYNDNNSYKFRSMIDYLRIKLREELREDKGGVYGVGVRGFSTDKPIKSYSITISFNSDPGNTDDLIKAAKAVIQKATTEAPNEQDMKKVKETQRQGRIKDLKQNRFWQSQIVNEHDRGKNFEKILLENFEKKINALTPDDIKNAAGSYFDYNSYIEIVMEPEKPNEN